MSSQWLTLPICALLVAAFCGELQAALILIDPDEMQLIAEMAMPWEDQQEGESDPFLEGDLSALEYELNTQVVPVACGALEVKWVSHFAILTFSRERLMLPPPTPSCLLKVPILGLSGLACSR